MIRPTRSSDGRRVGLFVVNICTIFVHVRKITAMAKKYKCGIKVCPQKTNEKVNRAIGFRVAYQSKHVKLYAGYFYSLKDWKYKLNVIISKLV